MCDSHLGELILSFREGNEAARGVLERIGSEQFPEIRYRESVHERVGRIGLKTITLRYDYHLLDVPPAQELATIALLEEQYRDALARSVQ